jgi:hypothetical protein
LHGRFAGEGDAFLAELGFASPPWQAWWTPGVLLAMILLLRIGMIVCSLHLNFEKR